LLDSIYGFGDEMPENFASVFSFIFQITKSQFDEKVALFALSQILIVRTINPLIIAPLNKIIEIDEGQTVSDVISIETQRNLLLVAKVLNAISNNIQFGKREEYMLPMAEFVQEQYEKMREFLLTIGNRKLTSPNEDERKILPSEMRNAVNDLFKQIKHDQNLIPTFPLITRAFSRKRSIIFE